MKHSSTRISLLLAASTMLVGGAGAAQFTDQADVTSVRGVYDTSSRTHCWVDREQVVDRDRSDVNVPGAIVGGIVGGVLGHQVGGGRGRDIATAGGAVAGAAIGANAGRDDRGDRVYERQVERCQEVPASGRPAYWDVQYTYGGQVFNTQLNYEPGPQIPVRVSVDPQ
jgi:uncharacterized protein YcfJ